MSVLLEARHVTKVFGGGRLGGPKTVALEDFSLEMEAGNPTITAVVGESGCGKTTMARLLLGLETPTRGAVHYRGQDLRELGRRDYLTFRKDVQAIFQDPFEVFNSFYRIDRVLHTPIDKFRLAGSKAEKERMILDALQAVGLRPEETLGRFPHQLSGGQRQRIMVARALLLRPRVIIADEPVSMIDASLRATVLANLRQLKEAFGISLIYITHDLTTAYQISDNIIVLYRGAVAEAGDVELVVKAPQHPYTQLLVSSVPLPNPKKRWGDDEMAPAYKEVPTDGGCKFVARCPHAIPTCLEARPPLYQTNPHRVAACYLWQEHSQVAAEEMDSVFVGKGASLQS